MNNKQDHIQPENIVSQPDIDYITMITSDDDILKIDDEQIISPSSTDRKQLLYDNEFKAYRLSSLQLKTAKAMLDQEVVELEHKSVQEMLLNPDATTTSYADHYEERDFLSSLYLSSFIISSPGCNDKYKCKACNKEYTNRQSFRVHHRSKLHLKNFDDWIKAKEQENLVEPLNKKQKLSNDAIIQAKKTIANHRQIHGMAQVKFFMASKQFQNKEKPIEVIDLPKQISDQEFCDFTKASQALKNKCPAHLPDFKRNIVNVLSIIYFDRNYCTLDVHFDERFYNTNGHQRHWVPVMFEGLKRRPYSREFMQQHMDLGDLSFVHETQAQLEETKEINGMARLLFPIFLECQFIPVSYVILLAVLMNTTEDTKLRS